MKKNHANAADMLRNGAKRVFVSTAYLDYRALSDLAMLAKNCESELVITVCDNMSADDIKGVLLQAGGHVSIDMR